ncbi:MAG: DEAD/DEAH box helicase family protein [Candidatus Pacebacteria bacterium]|nr:DEAD/DEAH box helicase family protein [Candidatus Paceibacterota bacterium]
MKEENKNQGFVVNSPYKEPLSHFEYDENSERYDKKDGRRKAGYYATIGKQEAGTGATKFFELDLANMIRPRVRDWKEKGYPNVSSITKKLLDHWNRFEKEDFSEEGRRYFWCQLEAIETIIWLTEAPDADKVGINLKDKSDGEWLRSCTKLATGTGKTVVMSMLIAWQALNKITNPKDTRFSKNILVMAPGITVKDRLDVLIPSTEGNYYEVFDIIPASLKEYIYQAKIVTLNWHALAPKKKESLPKVMQDAMGEESDKAFTKRVLSEFPGDTPIIVINDEAHHCHRHTAEIGKSKEEKDLEKKENEEATIWVQGLDKIHKARGIITAYDLSATPFVPKGRTSNTGFELFEWIVSDFGLHDAIESGLVKTPTIAVRDSSYGSNQVKGDRSKLFHIYYEEGVKENLNQKCEPNVDLPDLVRSAFKILSTDWLSTKNDWSKGVPPSMIVICNNTFTSKRIEYSILNSHLGVNEIAERDRLLRVDSSADDITDENLREKFNTVGKQGKPGADIQCVIGVNMLSEGWDASNVKQVLGLRAFTSQLLCEQVIGRGLRRMSYEVDENTGLLKPEYVTVFGIPFSFLPIEGKGQDKPEDEKPKTFIQVLPQKKNYQILFPNILRIQKEIEYYVNINWDKVEKITLSPTDNPVWVKVAPVIDRPDLSQSQKMDSIQDQLGDNYRLKQSIFAITTTIKSSLDDTWNNIDEASKFQQIFKIVSDFIDTNITIDADESNYSVYKNILISLNITRIASTIRQAINLSQSTKSYPVPDPVNKFKTTAVMTPWYTTKEVYSSSEMKSHMSHLVQDSKWEGIGKILDNEIDDVQAWVKNDHLGFTIPYVHKGMVRSYFPDFIIKYKGNKYLMLEIKGKEREQDQTKWESAKLWCESLNTDKDSWGEWQFKVVKNKPTISDLKWE